MSNYQFKTTNIRGKQYVEVNERIKFFRQEEQYKGWSITTEVKEMTDTDVIMCTTIRDATGLPIATGHAHEVKGSSNINKTSHIENCETSAVGRALAMLGIGIDTSIASANEVETAIAQSEQPRDTKPSSCEEGGKREQGGAEPHGSGSRLFEEILRPLEGIRSYHQEVRIRTYREAEGWTEEVRQMMIPVEDRDTYEDKLRRQGTVRMQS